MSPCGQGLGELGQAAHPEGLELGVMRPGICRGVGGSPRDSQPWHMDQERGLPGS